MLSNKIRLKDRGVFRLLTSFILYLILYIYIIYNQIQMHQKY